MRGGGSIIMRSFAEAMGFNWPRDLASIIDGKRVTWAEVHAARTERQARRLASKRQTDPPKIQPAYVWVFFNPQMIPYHGWYCYIVTRQEQYAVNFRGFDERLALSLMRAIPLDGLFPVEDNFDRWMAALAKRYPRHRKGDPRKAGSVVGWWDRENHRFALSRESLHNVEEFTPSPPGPESSPPAAGPSATAFPSG